MNIKANLWDAVRKLASFGLRVVMLALGLLALVAPSLFAQVNVDTGALTSGIESGFNTAGGIGVAMLAVALLVGVIVFGLNLRKRR